jgi:hypothetical protein
MYRQKMVPDVSYNVRKLRQSEFVRRDSCDLLLLLKMRPQWDALDFPVEGEPALSI